MERRNRHTISYLIMLCLIAAIVWTSSNFYLNVEALPKQLERAQINATYVIPEDPSYITVNETILFKAPKSNLISLAEKLKRAYPTCRITVDPAHSLIAVN